MKILLIGEYSGAFYNLANILKKKDHDVFWIHDGDDYKKISGANFKIEYKYIDSNIKIIKFILKVYYLLIDFIGIKGVFQLRRNSNIIEGFKDYDVVQLVNTKPLSGFGSYANLIFLKKIMRQNKYVYLSALGDDYYWVKNCLEKKVMYSMFDRMNIFNFYRYTWALLYVYGFGAKRLNNVVLKNVKAVIPGLYDYYHAYKAQKVECEELVPLIVEICKDDVLLNFHDTPIRIFHGWQKNKELRKGNDIFHDAVIKLKNKYPDKIEYEIVTGLPFEEYITKYRNSHIFIDQCYSLDRGMNGLLGMASGKVVLSGFEYQMFDYFKLDKNKKFLVNVKPSVNAIYDILEFLILNPSEMEEISKNSLEFIGKYHNPETIYNSYMSIWNKDRGGDDFK